MTISEAAKLSRIVKRQDEIWELDVYSTRAVTYAHLIADDWEPMYEKVEVKHGSFPWAMYMMVEKGMEVRPENVRGWMRAGHGEIKFSAYDYNARWECRKPADEIRHTAKFAEGTY